MNLLRSTLIAIISVLAFIATNAKTATWAIHPKYEKLTRHNGNLFLFQQNEKWGVIKTGDELIVPANYDFITPFVNGYALLVSKDGSKYRLEGILDELGALTPISERYYLSVARNHYYAFFSEDKLVVSNSKGKFGYIFPDGSIAIRCQFDDALPFAEKWAPVLQGNYMWYINDRFDRDKNNGVLRVDFHNGELTDATCFSNGQAAVAYNNDDFAIINRDGEKIRKIKETEFDRLSKCNNTLRESSEKGFGESSLYNIIAENGKYGIQDGETIIVKPQFELISTQYSDETLLTSLNGQYGLLKISEGDIELTISSQGGNAKELDVDRDGHPTSVTVDYKIPSYIQAPKVLVDPGDGAYRDLTAQGSDHGEKHSLSLTPVIINDAESCVIKGTIESDGILLVDYEKTFTVNYPIVLRVSKPGPESEIWAKADDYAYFSSTIYNDSHKTAEVTATWSNGDRRTVQIDPRQHKTVSSRIKVESDFTRKITIVLSTGESASKEILFHKFF